LGIGAILFNAALMVSDRAPTVLRRVFGDWVRRLSERIDAGQRIASVTSDPRLPPSDSLVHVAVWAVAVALVGLAVWTWRGLVVGGVVVLGCSLVIELSQGRLSDTRQVERRDAMANALGVGLGVVAVALCYVAWSTVARMFERDPRPRWPVS